VKIHLSYDNLESARSGYQNIDYIAENDSVMVGDIKNLDWLVDDGEAEEIIADDVLGHFPAAQVDDVLDNWLRKLSKGGYLTIITADLKEVARSILAEKITTDQANQLLFGKQDNQWRVKKSAFCLSQLVEVLTNRNYKVVKRRVQSMMAVVTIQR
jgi:predicted SAM-dependent methyltransferase